MITLGLKPFGHDASAAIVIDGKAIVASAEERFNREKHSGKFPYNAIKFSLKEAGISDINKIDEISIIFDYWKLIRYLHIYGFFKFFPAHTKTSFIGGLYQAKKISATKRILKEELGYKGKIKFLDHHNCHAATAYYTSSFDSAAVLTVDGRGERACTRIYNATGTELKQLIQMDYPDSLGVFYTSITEYLGFKRDEDEGKIMGLAPYGSTEYVEKMKEVLDTNGKIYKLNLSYFEMQNSPSKNVSDKFIKIFGPRRAKEDPLTQRHKDIARAAQILLEEAMINLTKYAKELTGEGNLCLSGGVALNSVANGRILQENIFDNIYIYPAASDDGACIGAALYSYYQQNDKRVYDMANQTPYLGYTSNEAEILKAIKKNKLHYKKSTNIEKDVAKLIAENKFVGWYQGRAEFGPRALGNRSIVVDPRKAENKDLVNARIKFREGFRPFAPSVLVEYAKDYFEMDGADSPYMILAFDVKKDKQKVIPAVTHVDGTARVQTVTTEQNERYWNLINEFHKLTGVPVILNTSFNRMGEPIVNTPEEAINCFLGSGLDAVALGDYLLIKKTS
jgi:carbamoyltransferase